jgi:hypothetical protein
MGQLRRYGYFGTNRMMTFSLLNNITVIITREIMDDIFGIIYFVLINTTIFSEGSRRSLDESRGSSVEA